MRTPQLIWKIKTFVIIIISKNTEYIWSHIGVMGMCSSNFDVMLFDDIDLDCDLLLQPLKSNCQKIS